MVLNLIGCGGDGSFLHQFFEEGNGKVGYADGFCLSGFEDGFHLFPGLGVGPGGVEVAGAVGMLGEVWVVAFGVHGYLRKLVVKGYDAIGDVVPGQCMRYKSTVAVCQLMFCRLEENRSMTYHNQDPGILD